jgi:APA family basic amino acid/polyamine antiporter
MTDSKAGLRRSLGFWTACAVVVGTVIGSGIFLVPSDMIRAVGSPGMVFAVWIFGGVLTMFGALSYAELSAAMPAAGGEYVYLTAAYGPLSGFLLGWTYTSVGFTASIAAKAAALFTYLADFFPGLNRVVYTLAIPIGPHGGPLEIHYGQLLGIVVIFGLASVNYVGVRAGGGVQLVTTTLKMLLIAGIIAVGLASGQGSASNLHSATPATPGGVAGFFAALVAALWAYDGWNYAGMIGGEVERPGRTLPRVLILGTGAVIGIYMLTNLAYFYLLSGTEVGSSPRVAADAMRRAVGPAGGAIVSIAAIISIFASLNGSFLAGPRVPYAMARRGYFFAAMGRAHPKFHTPGAGIVLFGVWSSLLLLSGRFEDLYRMVIFTEWIFYGMTAAAVLVLRRKRPEMNRPYRVLGYPLVPILFVLVSIALLYSTLMTSPRESGIGLALIAAGLPFYYHWKRAAKRTQRGSQEGGAGSIPEGL